MIPMTYSLLDSTGLCINHVAWDGKSDWQPPEGCTLVQGSLKIDHVYRFDSTLNQWVDQTGDQPLTEEQLLAACDYQAFWDALLISKVYQAIRAKACTDLSVNVCCTEFVAALSDAKAGRANKNAIQTCIHLILQADEFTAEQLAELQQLLVTGNMQNVYHLS